MQQHVDTVRIGSILQYTLGLTPFFSSRMVRAFLYDSNVGHAHQLFPDAILFSQSFLLDVVVS